MTNGEAGFLDRFSDDAYQSSLPWWRGRDFMLALLIFIFALTIYMYKIFDYPFWDPWEPHYAQVAMEMEQNSDWLAPHYRHSTNWFSKPIMLLWMIRASFATLGQSDGAARVPVVIIAAIGLSLFYLFTSRLFGWRSGLFSTLVLSTCPQYYFLARQAIYDMPYVVFQMSALGFLAVGLFKHEDNPRWQYPFWIFSALAMLTKGLLAIAVPGVVVLTFIIVTWDWAVLKRMRFVSGTLVFLAICLPWYTFMTVKYGTRYLNEFFIYHHFKRAMGEISKPNATFELYVQQLFYAVFPWISFLPMALIRFMGWGDDDFKGRRGLRLFIMLSFIMPFLFFEVQSTKFNHYIFPVIPFVAVIVGTYLSELIERKNKSFLKLEMILALLLFILVAKDFMTHYKHFIHLWIYYYSRPLPTGINPHPLYYATFIPMGVVIGLPLLSMAFERWVLKRDPDDPLSRLRHFSGYNFALFFVLAVILAGVNNYWLVPRVTQTFSQKILWDTYQKLAVNNEPICEYHSWERRSASYYFNNRNFYIDSRRPTRLDAFFKKDGKLFCMVERSDYNKLRSKVKEKFGKDLYIVENSHPSTYLVATEPLPSQKVSEGEYILKEKPVQAEPADVTWNNRIKLVGYELDKQSYKVGDPITITLYFEALEDIVDDWEIFLHLEVERGGRMIGDHLPANGSYPTGRWKKGQIVKDVWKGRVADRLAQGRMEIYVGFFSGDKRLEISAGRDDGESRSLFASAPLFRED